MRPHARLGPSSAYRWMKCPRSVPMSEGIPTSSSIAADEGTCAHAMAEWALEKGGDAQPHELVGRRHCTGIVATEEMANAAKLFVDLVRQEAQGGELRTETCVDLQAYGPPEPLFGTADALVLHKRRLTVIDLKYGRWPVEVANNEQLRCYGAGAVAAIDRPIDFIDLVIVQPRARHPGGPIRRESLTRAELDAWIEVLIKAAWATTEPDAPIVPGAWCTFCPAKQSCPVRAELSALSAADEFDAVPAPDGAGIAEGWPSASPATSGTIATIKESQDG